MLLAASNTNQTIIVGFANLNYFKHKMFTLPPDLPCTYQ